MQETLKINDIAYKKIVYHCLRYPSAKVIGALIKSSNQITDAYPLFHTGLSSPSLSLALDLIESNLPSGSEIAGFYEFCDKQEPTLSKIVQSNQQLKNFIFLTTQANSQEIIVKCQKMKLQTPQFSSIRKDLVNGQHRLIVDMDAHLEQVELDFRNTYVK